MLNFLNVDNTAFVLLEYPMSYIELIGTLLYLWSVWLIAKRQVLTWPVGIVSVLLYMILFYQIRLYSDAIEQVYYLGVSIYGWIFWNNSFKEDGEVKDVAYSNPQSIVFWITITGIISIVVGILMQRIHLLLPVVFPEPASFPFLDALTTIMSFTAMWLMARKRIESWIYWIIVDVIGIWLYFVKDVKFVSLLYVTLFFLAVSGFQSWHKTKTQAVPT